MTIEIIPYSSREEWLEIRRKHNDVTASEIAALMGLHPYKTALQVYLDKIGQGSGNSENPHMRRGRILEPAVAEAVREESPGWYVWKATSYYRDGDLRLGATPDWYFMTTRDAVAPIARGILETKTANPFVFDRAWHDGPPIAYVLQTLTQMMLAEVDHGAIACMVTSPDFPVHIYNVQRNAAAEIKIVNAVEKFWQDVESKTPPKADPTRDAQAMAALFPRESKPVLDLSGDNMLPGLLEERAQLMRFISDSEDSKSRIDAEIKEKIGDHEGAALPGWKITWKTQHRKETVIPAKDMRVLRVTRTKELA